MPHNSPGSAREYAAISGVPIEEAVARVQSWRAMDGEPEGAEVEHLNEDDELPEEAREEMLQADAVRAVMAPARRRDFADKRLNQLVSKDRRYARLVELAEARDQADSELRRAICFYREFTSPPLPLTSIAVAIGSGASAVSTMYGDQIVDAVSADLNEAPLRAKDVGARVWNPGESTETVLLGTDVTDGSDVIIPWDAFAVSATGYHAERVYRLIRAQWVDHYYPLVTREPAEFCFRANRAVDEKYPGLRSLLSLAADLDSEYPGLLWGDVTDEFMGYDGYTYPLAGFIDTYREDETATKPHFPDLWMMLYASLYREPDSPDAQQTFAGQLRLARIARAAATAPAPTMSILVGDFTKHVEGWAESIPVLQAPRRQRETEWTLHKPDGTTTPVRLGLIDTTWCATINDATRD